MNFIDALDEQLNTSVTENGAIGYKTTKKPLLDMNFRVSSYRNLSDSDIINDFKKSYEEDKIHTLKWLFYCRDIREGLGERRTFKIIMKYLSTVDTEIVIKLLPLFPEYGRWDDLFCVVDTLFENVATLCKNTLTADLYAMKSNKSVSLLAKWMPSENASNIETKKLAKRFIQYFNITPARYRKLLSKLRSYIDVTECKMSTNQWDKIDYNKVPSKANLIYNNAFLKHDRERREEFFNKIKEGTAKINSSVLYPYEIVHKYNSESFSNEELELLWKNLPDIVPDMSSTIVVADGSGSMYSTVGNTKVTALEVANSLAIYCAERCKDEFKARYITFSAHPQLVDFSACNSLLEKLLLAMKYDEVSNTNIYAVFELILNTAISNHMKQEDLPSNILILSDMEFDTANKQNYYEHFRSLDNKLFEEIKAKYIAEGYKIPRLIFWNLCSRTNTVPVKENALGVTLVSGFSPNILKMVMSDKLDPYSVLIDILDSERYEKVEKLLI